MASLQDLVSQPDFADQPADVQRKLAARVDPEFGKLGPEQQDRILTRTSKDPIGFAEKRYGLQPGTLGAIQQVESGGNPNAQSPTGVQGLMQITKDTARRYGLPPQYHMDPAAQIDTAGRIMADNLKTAKGDLHGALALYGDHNDKGYADRVLARMQTGAPSSAPEQPPPTEAGVTPTTTTATTPTTTGATERDLSQLPKALQPIARIGASALYDGLYWPASRLNALGYSFGLPWATDPAQFKRDMLAFNQEKGAGVPYAEELATNTPTGIIDRTFDALSPLEATYAPTFGTYALVRGFTGQEHYARAAEALVGAGAVLQEGIKIAANVKASRMVRAATEAAQEATADAVKEAESAHKAGAAVRDRFSTDIIATPEKPVPSAPAASRAEIGQQMQAIGGAAKDLAPAGVERVGLSAMSERLRKEVSAAYQHTQQLGDAAGIVLPAQSGHNANLVNSTVDFLNTLTQAGVNASPAEKALANDLTAALGMAIDPATGKILPSSGADLKFSQLIDAHSMMGNAAISPQEYPVSHSIGDRAFVRLRGELKSTIDTLAEAHPEVTEAWDQARAIFRDRQIPFEKTARAMLKARTPEQASAYLFNRKSSSDLIRVLQESSPPEVHATLRAGLRDIFREGMDSRGNMDFVTAQKTWEQLAKNAPEKARLYAAYGHPLARSELFDQIAAHKINTNTSVFRQAMKDMGDLFAAQAEESTKIRAAAESPEKGAQHVLEMRKKPLNTTGQSFWMRRAGITLAVGGATALAGHPTTALVSSGLYVWWATQYPRLVAQALRTPLNTQKGMMLAKALQGLARSFRPPETTTPPSP